MPINLNVDLNNILPPSNDPTQGVLKTEGQVPPPTVKDTLSGQNVVVVTEATIGDIDFGSPKPTPPTQKGMENLNQLGAHTATTGPGGPGGLANPWFRANPSVAFSIAFLNYYNALRESKSQMGEMLEKQVGINFDNAQTLGKLALDAAKKEAEQHIVDAVVAGVQAGVALAGTIVSASSLYKSLNGSSPEMRKAQAELDAKDSNGKTLKQNAGEAEGELNDAKVKLKQAQDNFDNHQKTLPKEGEGDGQAGTTSDAARTKAKEKTAELQTKLDEAKANVTAKQKAYDKAEANYQRAKDDFTSAKRHYMEKWERIAQLAQTGGQFLNKLAESGGSIAKASIAVEKGLIEQQKIFVQADQEINRRLGETISQSYNNASENMNQLIQNIKKIEDELIRAMSMTRN